ncbi:Protein of unknown function [Cotesia congregata]|uniref:PML C-terminal domain-containing protein n=1 Tax=Cotesia congregata TaxID=51543 RepID=A0A8J2MKD5_COTCN|nr:Protein of unknown function [Cotesia congregata]
MAHKASKNMCYSLSESSDYRWASAVCTKNDGEQYLSTVKEKLNLSPGKNTEPYAANRDSQRKRRAEASQMHSAKCRRNLLKQDRENLQNSEGVQYSPNCGFDTDINNNEDIELDELMEVDEDNLDSFNIVFFDIETKSLENFLKFLRVSPKPSILVAHNAKFDAKHLKSTIKGFTDTLVLFKKQFLDRKGKGLFKLSQLTKDLLPHRKTDNFHEAMFDVEILEELDLIINAKGLKEVVNDIVGAREVAKITGTLDVLKNYVSDNIIKKMALAKITYDDLNKIFPEKSEAGLSHFLSEKVNNKPRLTNRKNIIDNIVLFFQKNK